MIKLYFKRKIKKKYTHEIQKLCKISEFDKFNKIWLKNLNQEPFEDIVSQIKEMTSLITNIMLSPILHFNTYLASHLGVMKLLVVPINMWELVYYNNSNYIYFFVAMYLYSAKTKIDIIILFNHFNFLVF